jgi:hypothetical protein
MAEEVGRRNLGERCPECGSNLVELTFSFSEPDEPNALKVERRCSMACGYTEPVKDDRITSRTVFYPCVRQFA